MIGLPLKEWRVAHEDYKDPASEERKLFNEAKHEALTNSVLRFVAAFSGRLAAAMDRSTAGIRTYEMMEALESKRPILDGITKGGSEWTVERATEELIDTAYEFSRHAEISGKRRMVTDALRSIQPIKV